MDMEICASFSSDAGNEETHKCNFPLLTYLRCKKLHEDYKRRKDEGIKSFIIANNIKDVGTINEIVVRMECIKKQYATPKLIFMKCENNITDENQIKNFFESFNKIKDFFKQNNEPQNDHQETGSSRLTDHDESETILQEMFNCKFTDCEFFIVLKNLSSDFFCLRETKEKHDDAVQYLFGNAKGTEQKYQLQMETCNRIIKDNSETEIENLKLRIDEFCEKVTFLSIEEVELSSKNLIDEALLKCIGKFRRHKCMIIKTLFEEIKYILNSYEVCTFLTETTSLISDTINYIDLTMSLFTHLDTYNLHNFSLKTLQSQYEEIIYLPNKHNIIKTQFPRYEKIKILNLFINLSKTNLCICINNDEDNIKWKSARKTYSYKHKIRVYVYIEEGLQLPEDEGANEIFVRVEHANETNISIQEKLSMDDVNIPANMKMIFQGYEIQANTLCSNWKEFLEEDAVCDILETNKLTVGCRLPYIQDSYENLQFQINVPSEEMNIELLESNPKLKTVNEDYLLNDLSNKVNAILTGDVETINYKSLLAFTIKCKKKFISKFVYFIELRQFNEILEANENFNDACEFLVSEILRLRGIEKTLFINACIYTGKVMIFFYGLDKLSTCAGNTCIKLVMTLKETKIWKMFISGKQNIVIPLESDLQQNSIQFIKNIFPENLKCLLDTWKQKVNLPQDETNYQRVKDCASKIIGSLKLEEILLKEILVIPLQMKLFEDSYCGKIHYKEFDFDIIKLLETFINSKVFLTHSEIPITKFSEYQESRRNKYIREQLRGSCQLIASIVVPVLIRNQTQYSCNLFCALCEDLGLISYNRPHLPLGANITIAEYLAAQFISKYSLPSKKYSRMEVCPLPWEKYENLRKIMETETEIKNILQYSDIFCKTENELPIIESYTTPIHQAVSEGNINILKILCQRDKSFINLQNNYDETPLHIACFKGETEAVTFLLENDCSVNMRDKNGDTALHIAALQDQSEISKMLLRHKGKESLINLPNSLGKTALHIACIHGNLNVFDVLMKEENIAVNSFDNDENSVLHYAAERDQTQIIERLLKHDEQLLNIQNKSGKTALHIASRQGYTCAVKLLLRYDCSAVCRDQHGDTAFHVATREDKNEIMEILNDHDNSLINAPNAAACTPLHIATFYNNIDALNFLLDKGCKLDCLDTNGDTAFHIAAQEGYTYIMEILFQRDESLLNLQNAFGYTPLHYASFNGNIGIVKFLLDNDCYTELQDLNGNTAFHFAAFKNEIEIMEHILENVENIGSIIYLQNKFGNTPLHIASFLGNTGAVLFILRYSCVLSQGNNEGDTAFHFAARNKEADFMEALLSCDATVINNQNNDGNTPLHIAVRCENTKAVTLLLRNNCIVTKLNKDGDTAFHFLTSKNEVDIMIRLLEHNSSLIDMQNKNGDTPMHLACREGKTEAANFLLSKKCNINIRDRYGETAFYYALKNGQEYIIELMMQHHKSLISDKHKFEERMRISNMENDASVLDHNGKYEEALRILTNFIEARTKILGASHPDTVSCMKRKALTFKEFGHYAESLRMYNQVAETKSAIFDDTHYETHTRNSKMGNPELERKQKSTEPQPSTSATSDGPYIENTDGDEYSNIDEYTLYNNFCNILAKRFYIEKEGLDWYKKKESDKKIAIDATLAGIEKISCKIICPEFDITEVENMKDVNTVICDHLGLITHINPPRFSHRSCGEFLAAKYIVKQLRTVNTEIIVKFRSILIVDILVNDEYNVIRKFIDSALLHNKIMNNCNFEKVEMPRKNIMFGMEALFVAVHENNLEIMKFLILCNPIVVNATETVNNGMTPLMIACSKEKTDIVTYILTRRECTLNIVDVHGQTALHYAGKRENIHILKLLLERDPTLLNKKDFYGFTALHIACRFDNYEAAKYLVSHPNCSVTVVDIFGKSALHYAAKSGNIKMVELFLDRDSAMLNVKDVKGVTLLHEAVKYEFEVVLFLILDCKFPTNVVDWYGRTVLHYAAIFGSKNAIKFLIKKDQSLMNRQDCHGMTALHFACKYDKYEVLKCLLEYSDCLVNVKDILLKNAIHYLTETHFDFTIETINLLLQRDITLLNEQDIDGNTALHIACSRGNIQIVKHLISYRCRLEHNEYKFWKNSLHTDLNSLFVHICSDHTLLNMQNCERMTPLHIACKSNKKDTMHFLLSLPDCNVNEVDSTGKYAIHYAASIDNVSIISLLLEKDFTLLNKQDFEGNTSLDFACRNNKYEAANFLLSYPDCVVNLENILNFIHSAKDNDYVKTIKVVELILQRDHSLLNKQREDGTTPLMFACKNGKSEVAKFLLSHSDCVMNFEDTKKRNSLHYAAENGCTEVLKIILERERTLLNKHDKNGMTPLHFACKEGNNEAANLLLSAEDCSLHLQNEEKRFAIHYAAENNSCVEILQNIIERDRTLFNKQDINDMTPLHFACKEGNNEAANFLLSNEDCSVHIQDEKKRFAIHYAAENLNVKILKHMLERDHTLLNKKDENDMTPLHYSCIHNGEAAKFLLSLTECDVSTLDKKNRSALHYAIEELDIEVFKLILERDFSLLNRQDIDGNSPLHLACKSKASSFLKSKSNAVEYLLSLSDCLISIENNMGRTPLDFAYNTCIEYLDMRLVETFLEHDNTLLDKQDIKIETLMDIVFDEEEVDEYKNFFNNKYFKFDLKDDNDNTFFHAIANTNNSYIITYLINILLERYPQLLNMQNINCQTALHIAAKKYNFRVLNFLLNRTECNVSVKDENGDTALHIYVNLFEEDDDEDDDVDDDDDDDDFKCFSKRRAEKCDHPFFTIKQFINRDHSLLNMQSNSGQTPLHTAVQKGNSIIVRYLIYLGADTDIQDKNGNKPLDLARQLQDLSRKHRIVSYLHNKGMTIVDD